MEADDPVKTASPPLRLTKLPPSGRALGGAALFELISAGTSPRAIAHTRRTLEHGLGGRRVVLFGSAREGLVALLTRLRSERGRREIVLPAYCCYSVAAAAVAAGLRVRLVDVDARGRIDAAQLAGLPLESVCAVLVGNLFGLAEPIQRIVEIAGAAGCAVIDDAAQSFGARDEAGGIAGSRGDFGLLSFGRGKPLSALGGGAVAEPRDRGTGLVEPATPTPRAVRGAMRAVTHAVAMQGLVFRVLSGIPALGIGETVYDPAIRPGPIDSASLALLRYAVEHAREEAGQRAAVASRLAEAISARSAWTPLRAEAGAVGVYPRLAVVAPDAAHRDAAIRALDRIGAGASALYPRSLADVPELAEHTTGGETPAGARSLAARIITLPTHGGLGGSRLEQTLEILAAAS